MALINIGSTKQLFVDDYLIESMSDTKQVMNPAEKVENNPVIRPEKPWEGNDVRFNNIIFDEADQVFKLWYSARVHSAQQGDGEIIVKGEFDDGTKNCLAVSEDAVNWERPNLGMVEFGGSKNNNILAPDQQLPLLAGQRDSNTYFFQDNHEQDPSKRYKGFVRTGSTTTPGMQFHLYFSKDAFNWIPYENNPVIDTAPRVGRWGPTNFMGWDSVRGVYAAHMENCLHRRSPLSKRLIGRAESTDLINWSEPETILLPDQDDSPDTEFYAMPTIVYENIYVAMPWIFSTTNTTHHPELAFSRDGIHYERRYRSPFINRGSRWDFDCTSLYAKRPIIHNGNILMFYTGTNWRSPAQLLQIGEKATAAVGLATLPLDGFVSLDGTKGEKITSEAKKVDGGIPEIKGARIVPPYSQMVTRAFSFTGTQLYLNIKAALKQWGAEATELRVEVLEPNHELVEGHSFKDCDPITESGQAYSVSWNGSSDISKFAGRAIKLRFYFKNCKLYSFQFK